LFTPPNVAYPPSGGPAGNPATAAAAAAATAEATVMKILESVYLFCSFQEKKCMSCECTCSTTPKTAGIESYTPKNQHLPKASGPLAAPGWCAPRCWLKDP
jgi:hypothetical protein